MRKRKQQNFKIVPYKEDAKQKKLRQMLLRHVQNLAHILSDEEMAKIEENGADEGYELTYDSLEESMNVYIEAIQRNMKELRQQLH